MPLWGDPGEGPEPDVRRAVLERCLELMRGNRSTSCATFFDDAGRLRFVQPWSTEDVAPPARDAQVLDRAERALRHGVGF